MRRRLALLLWLLPVCPSARLPVLSAQQPTVDVTAYVFRIDLPDTGSVIHGWATVSWRKLAGYDDTLRLDLVGMHVDKVVSMTRLTPVPFRYEGRVLRIASRRLDQARLSVMVEY